MEAENLIEVEMRPMEEPAGEEPVGQEIEEKETEPNALGFFSDTNN